MGINLVDTPRTSTGREKIQVDPPEGNKLDFVQSSEYDPTNIESDGSRNRLRGETHRGSDHGYAYRYAGPQEAHPRGIHKSIAKSLHHGHIMHDV